MFRYPKPTPKPIAEGSSEHKGQYRWNPSFFSKKNTPKKLLQKIDSFQHRKFTPTKILPFSAATKKKKDHFFFQLGPRSVFRGADPCLGGWVEIRSLAGFVNWNPFPGRFWCWGCKWWDVSTQIVDEDEQMIWGLRNYILLENKLMLISINFTPKTSHSCLKKWYTRLSGCFLTWPMAKRLKLFGITYLGGKISRSNLFFQGPLAKWVFLVWI